MFSSNIPEFTSAGPADNPRNVSLSVGARLSEGEIAQQNDNLTGDYVMFEDLAKPELARTLSGFHPPHVSFSDSKTTFDGKFNSNNFFHLLTKWRSHTRAKAGSARYLRDISSPRLCDANEHHENCTLGPESNLPGYATITLNAKRSGD